MLVALTVLEPVATVPQAQVIALPPEVPSATSVAYPLKVSSNRGLTGVYHEDSSA